MVAFGNYLEQLCNDLAASMQRMGVNMSVQSIVADLPASTALPLALIANELVTNAFKHGCAAGATLIEVRLEDKGEALMLSVCDNGTGINRLDINAEITETSPQTKSLGFRLIEMLSRQIDATLTLPQSENPPKFTVIVPKPKKSTGKALSS